MQLNLVGFQHAFTYLLLVTCVAIVLLLSNGESSDRNCETMRQVDRGLSALVMPEVQGGCKGSIKSEFEKGT